MKIHSREAVAGGYMVTIEVENSYTDGSSRYDPIFVSDALVDGKSPEEILGAIHDSFNNDPIRNHIGGTVVAQTQTKDIFLSKSIVAYEAWQRAKITRVEAQSRTLSAPIITTLTNLEDVKWAKYLVVLNDWRLAPV